MRSRHLCSVGLLVASTSAQAHGEAVVFALLLWFGLFGGVAAGVFEAINPWRRLGPGWWFAIYLALLGVAAAVVAGSLEAFPYAVGYGAFLGVVPFMLLFFLFRFLATSIRAFRAQRSQQARNRSTPSA